jgi:glycosyltransferase involved in cell wall biosynthesis
VYGWATQNNGCSKYRIWQPLEMLSRLGLAEVRREPDDPRPVSAARLQKIFRWADVVVAQPFCELWAAGLLFGARDAFNKAGGNKKIVIDLDDNIYAVHPLNVGTHEGKLIYLSSRFSGGFDQYWEVLEVPKGRERDFAARMDGMLFKQGEKVCFLRNKEPDGRLVATAMLEAADLVTTTNEELAKVFRKVTKAPVVSLPNCLDMKEWGRPRRPRTTGDWMGWCGSVSHYPDLKPLMPVLDEIMEKPQARFHVMGSSFDYLFPPKSGSSPEAVTGYHGQGGMFQVRLEDCAERWPGKMAFDAPVPVQKFAKWFRDGFKGQIGLAPIIESDFNAAKSELKWLEYAALKVPTVASNTGPYARTIRHGEDGLLCGSNGAWRNALEALLEDRGLRQKIGLAAHERLRAEYDAEKRAGDWLRTYKGLA